MSTSSNGFAAEVPLSPGEEKLFDAQVRAA
jgi:hypothetical protein